MKKWVYISCLLQVLYCSQLILANSQDEIDLQLNLPKGFSASITITWELNSLNKDIPGLNKDVKDYNKTIEEYQIDCLDVDADGNMTVKQTWESIKEIYRDMDGNMCVRFDSRDSSYPIPETEVFSKNLIGQSMVFEIDPGGEILDISGYEKIARKMTRPALKHLHLGKDGIVKRLKNWSLFGIPEFCSAGPVKVRELHTETTIPDIKTIPKTVSYSKKWSLKEISDGLAHYEITIDRVKEQKNDITDFEGKRTEKLYTEKNETCHLTCDITTGLIINSQQIINSSSRDIHGDYDQSETVREYSSNGLITIETVINKAKAHESISLVILLSSIFGILFLLGLLNIFRLIKEHGMRSKLLFSVVFTIIALVLFLFVLLQPLITRLVYTYTNH